MNNLHRELAPISSAAWAQIEDEATRTLKRYLAARRVVDVQGPSGEMLSAVGTGHLRNITAPATGILARQIAHRLAEILAFDLDPVAAATADPNSPIFAVMSNDPPLVEGDGNRRT